MPSKLNPYLNFDGQTKEVMAFYKGVFGGELTMSSFKDGGMPVEGADADKVMHAQLIAPNGITIMCADLPKEWAAQHVIGTNVSLSLSGDDEAELRGYWDKLADGGKVSQPLVAAPWGDIFGMLDDKFGIRWLVNITPKK